MPGFDLVLLASPAHIREGRDESVPLARHRRDEAGVPVVVLQLDPQAPDMAIDDVALGDEIGAPDRIEDLVSRDDLPATAREQIEQALLDPAQVDDGVPGQDLTIEDIDLDLTELDGGHDWPVGSGRPPGDDDGPGQQFLRREWHRQDVVDAEIERLELRLEVAAPSEPKHRRRAPPEGVRRPKDPEQRRTVVVVHVDDGHVRPPLRQDRFRLGQTVRSTNDKEPVIQRQLDEVDHQLAIVEHERAVCVDDLWSGHEVIFKADPV